jgi:hypothetical protein
VKELHKLNGPICGVNVPERFPFAVLRWKGCRERFVNLLCDSCTADDGPSALLKQKGRRVR